MTDEVQTINVITDGPSTKYHIRFLDWNGDLLEEKDVDEGSTPVFSGSEPTREGYEFIGWTPVPYPADKDQDYTASYRVIETVHTLSFQDSQGKEIVVRPSSNTFTNKLTEIWFNDVLDTIIFRYKDQDGTHFCYINYSDLPSVELNAIIVNGQRYDNMATPYSVEITDDATVSLDTTNEYLIRFLDWDGKLLQSEKVPSGTIPEYTGQEPTRTGYEFVGWTPELSAVTKDQDYTASYEISKYSIRFLDGTDILQSSEVGYGTVPQFTGTLPSKEGQAFVGWNPTPSPADKVQDYVAMWAYQEAIVLYNCTCEDDRVDKSGYLTQIASVDGVFREDTDTLHPSVAIDCASFDPTKANYAYIGGFGRWYYIRRSRLERSPKGTVRRFEMDVDVLMSHRDAILANGAVIDRQEMTYDDELVDPILPVRVGNTVESYVVPNTTMASYDETSDDEYDTVIVVNAANTSSS